MQPPPLPHQSGHPTFDGGNAPFGVQYTQHGYLPHSGGYPPLNAGDQRQPPWMPKPDVPYCPPGLEYLTQLNQLIIKQKKELLEIVTNIETANKYVCLNTHGQAVYYCEEESEFFIRNCLKASHPFVMHIKDSNGVEVIRVRRRYKCLCLWQCFSCIDCCQDELEVEAPIGQLVGYVKQVYHGCSIWYDVKDASGHIVLRIHGPSYFHCTCFGEDIDFKVLSVDNTTEVGLIKKQWTNIIQELYTDADTFGVSFPMDLHVNMKATLIGAVFLIDFMFFEQNQRNASDRRSQF
ncbi:unnamed protein product [Dicrocoelium dendriticum]|nr:unnamed protein product [Dicrocoelium dendriticum]